MTELSCADVRDLAAELALDALDGDQRALVLTHLDDCPHCREEVDDLSRAADALLTVLPAHDVPPDLTSRLHASVPRRVEPRAAAPSRFRRPLLAAAAGLIIIVAGVVGLAVRDADAPGDGEGEFALVTPGGTEIGAVAITGGDDPEITMSLTSGEGTTTFTCAVVLDDGDTVTVGKLDITDGEGTWTGPLEPEPANIATAQLLDGDTVVATAQVG